VRREGASPNKRTMLSYPKGNETMSYRPDVWRAMGAIAYSEGRQARADGLHEEANPYRRHACREHWLDGWNDQGWGSAGTTNDPS